MFAEERRSEPTRESGPRVLLVEGPETASSLAPVLERLGWDVFTAGGVRDAVFASEVLTAVSARARPVAAIADLPTDAERRRLLDELHSVLPGIPIIIVADDASVESALAFTRAGAFDVLLRPHSTDAVMASLARALRHGGAAPPVSRIDGTALSENIVGDAPSFVDVIRLVKKVARSVSTALIDGETGTGKEIVARAIHALSPRAAGPFVALNCAAIPEPLLESELFGHEKGSFTGAIARKIGHFERASGGTLFLDEIGDLPISLQPKLLRALQERTVMRVGGDAPIAIDARIVAATHHDLVERTRTGEFREDLFYRLNVFPIHLPPLRERPSDIPLLAEHFLQRLASSATFGAKKLSPQAIDCLRQYRWPGNVRELQSTIERAWLMAETPEIGIADLPVSISNPQWKPPTSYEVFRIPDKGFVLDDFERALIDQAMERSNGVVAAAARLLGVSYRTLQYRLHKGRVTPRKL